MSGIFKGDSIYKSGSGGGGGYKDGGELVDADFIKVENNTISSYENVNRDPVNFYFDVKDGEVLNSVIELTTAVNATVNVYIIKNGFYYLLANVGGNTVNAGNDYKVNITGDSYDVEEESGGDPEPAFCMIDQDRYSCKKIGNYLWLTENYTGIIPGTDSFIGAGTRFYKPNETMLHKTYGDSWHIPTRDQVIDLLSAAGNNTNNLKIVNTGYTDWDTYATNSTGFNLYPYGDPKNVADIPNGLGWAGVFIFRESESSTFLQSVLQVKKGNNDYDYLSALNLQWYRNIRLCRVI